MTGPWTDDETIDLDPSPTSEGEKSGLFESEEEKGWKKLQNKKLKLENRQFKRDMANREQFAQNAYAVTQTWVGFVIVMTLSQFTLGKSKAFGLDTKEFIVVVTTTTASVFGFWLLVGRYLFHRPGEKPKNKLQKAPGKKRKKGFRKANA